jgi:hypothetical protein
MECFHLLQLEKKQFHQTKERALFANISFPRVLYFDSQHPVSGGGSVSVCVTDFSAPPSTLSLKVFVSRLRTAGQIYDLVAAFVHLLRALSEAGVEHRDINRF